MRIHATPDSVIWARREFEGARLGDRRNDLRLVAVAAGLCDRPGGKVSAVFRTAKERDGAYDFLENERVSHEAIIEGMTEVTAKRAKDYPFVYVPIDGTSLTLADKKKTKDFGRIGTHAAGARGIKVVDALAVDPQGVTLGWLDLRFWTRPLEPEAPRSTYQKQSRQVEDKETWYWLQTVEAVAARLDAQGARGWFQIDREGDSRDLLLKLQQSGHHWTVRNRTDRRAAFEDGEVGLVRAQLAKLPPQGHYELEVQKADKRSARKANMAVRVARVELRLRDQKTDRITKMPAHVVWAREEGTTPEGETPVDWLLLTNRDVTTLEQAREVVLGYAIRWRVEECHKTWKSDGCNIEETQLRSTHAVMIWAAIAAAVAARIERIKQLSRTQPELPASAEFTPIEVRALVLLKKRHKKRTEVIRDNPTIREAVLWIAELGGYTGKSSGGPPGSLTIRRGLEALSQAVDMMLALAEAGETS